MKKLIYTVVTASLLAICTSSYVSAAVPSKIFVEGKQIQSDVDPILENGRVLVPLRAMADSLHASVVWDQSTKTVTISKWSEIVKLTADKNILQYEKDGQSEQMTLDVPVKIISDRVYVPLRFLSQFFGYQVAASGDTVSVNSPLSQNTRDILYRGDLAEARRIVMDIGPKTAHYEQEPIEYTHLREGFLKAFLFPVGESNRFFLLSNDTVSFYELQDDFFVITWQAHIPIGLKDTVDLFLENKVINATGSKPEIKEFFYYRESGHAASTNITAGKIDSDGEKTVVGVKRITSDEVKEESGTLALKLSDEKRTNTSSR